MNVEPLPSRTLSSRPRTRLVAPVLAAVRPAFPASAADYARARDPLAIWHLASLDAPTVATLWTYFIARGSGVHFQPGVLVAMFLAVWMLYSADRLLDARHTVDLQHRHHFHAAHRRAFIIILLPASALLITTLTYMPHTLLWRFAVLAAALAIWLLLVHTRSAHGNALPKELAVAVFFPAAVFLPAATYTRGPHVQLASAALLFAALCALNCFLLQRWEHVAASRVHITTAFAIRHVRGFTVAIIAVSLCAAPLLHGNLWTLPIAVALSASALGMLDRARRNLSSLHLRALADAALLTPMLFLLR